MKGLMAAFVLVSALMGTSRVIASVMTSTISSILLFADGQLVYVYPSSAMTGASEATGHTIHFC